MYLITPGHSRRIHDNSSKDTSSNTTFGQIRQLVECNIWSKWTVGLNLYFPGVMLMYERTSKDRKKERNVSKIRLKLVENVKHLSRKKT